MTLLYVAAFVLGFAPLPTLARKRDVKTIVAVTVVLVVNLLLLLYYLKGDTRLALGEWILALFSQNR